MLNTVRMVFFSFMLLFGYTSFAQDQAAKDEAILKEYFAKNKIKATRTPSGLYYKIEKKGKGENAKKGQTVSVQYLGTFLDGKRFDGNMDANYKPERAPITFPVGVGQVIKGWDEGLQLLNAGSRAIFYIPSGIGYGPGGRGPIPPNSIMMFKVELVSVK
jgi:FKBP-type peptidyl-prolyl cis-trans isomerase FkpA